MAYGLLCTQRWFAAPQLGASLTLSSWMHLRMTLHFPLLALDATAKTPPTPMGARVTWKLMGQMVFTILITFITHCPDGVIVIIKFMPCQVGNFFHCSLKNYKIRAVYDSKSNLLYFPPPIQSTLTRRFRISGRGSLSGPAPCLERAPE